MDRYTKSAEFFPVKATVTSAETFELIYNHIICRFGLPETIVSDRGPQFNANLWEHLFKKLGCKINLSAPHHPETDGQTERVNGILKTYLRSYASHYQDNWVKLLPTARFNYNNTVSNSTLFSPFQLTYSFKPRSIADTLSRELNNSSTNNNNSDDNGNDSNAQNNDNNDNNNSENNGNNNLITNKLTKKQPQYSNRTTQRDQRD